MTTTQVNFAPYSDPPSTTPATPRYSPIPPAAPAASTSSYQSGAPVSSLGQGTSFSSTPGSGLPRYNNPGEVSSYAGLGYGSALEAAAAYAGGPFGACGLVMYEVDLDYVRFHAWQSALLCASLFFLHLVFLLLFSGSTMQTLLFMADVVLLGFLSRQAYLDADMESRFQLPYIGQLAQDWVEDE